MTKHSLELEYDMISWFAEDIIKDVEKLRTESSNEEKQRLESRINLNVHRLYACYTGFIRRVGKPIKVEEVETPLGKGKRITGHY